MRGIEEKPAELGGRVAQHDLSELTESKCRPNQRLAGSGWKRAIHTAVVAVHLENGDVPGSGTGNRSALLGTSREHYQGMWG